MRAAALLAADLDFGADFPATDFDVFAAEVFDAAGFFEDAVLCPAENTVRRDTRTKMRTELLILTVDYSLARKVAAEQNWIVISKTSDQCLIEVVGTVR